MMGFVRSFGGRQRQIADTQLLFQAALLIVTEGKAQ